MAGIEEMGVDPDAARAFVVQERPKPEVKPPPVRVVSEKAQPQQAADDDVEEQEEAAGEGRRTTAPRKPTKPSAAKRPHAQRLLATLLVPVTVRLRPEIASALKQASLQRQLNGIETYTQQDIVEEALVPWLQAEGLLD
ncbi:hypothetical protein J0H58_06730 [bacterium]|nr:hypothetical protein [bacterium]